MRRRVLVWDGVLALGLPLAWMVRVAVGKSSPAHPGELVAVSRRDIGIVVKATGVIKPMPGAEVKLGPRQAGVVRRLHVRVGDHVERGQLLVETDAKGLRARRDRAVAAVAAAAANLRYAQNDLLRQRSLAQTGAISLGALEQIERALAVAQAASLESKASLAVARAELDETRILSPISGMVALVSMQEGEMLSTSLASNFITIIDPRRLELWAYVDEIDIGRIQSRQMVRFGVDTYPEQEFEGEVVSIHPKPEIRDNVVNYIAVVKFAAPSDQVLRPEMTASARIMLERHEQVLAVPRRAVRRDAGQQFVMVVKGNVTERRAVTLGTRDEEHCEVTRGLREGERLLATNAPSDKTKKEERE